MLRAASLCAGDPNGAGGSCFCCCIVSWRRASPSFSISSRSAARSTASATCCARSPIIRAQDSPSQRLARRRSRLASLRCASSGASILQGREMLLRELVNAGCYLKPAPGPRLLNAVRDKGCIAGNSLPLAIPGDGQIAVEPLEFGAGMLQLFLHLDKFAPQAALKRFPCSHPGIFVGRLRRLRHDRSSLLCSSHNHTMLLL